jgi:hypothetical protein
MFFIPLFAENDVTIQIAKGDSLYNLLDNNGALEYYLAALQLDSMNYEANWKASRAYTDVGETIEDEDERATLYLKGSQLGQKKGLNSQKRLKRKLIWQLSMILTMILPIMF